MKRIFCQARSETTLYNKLMTATCTQLFQIGKICKVIQDAVSQVAYNMQYRGVAARKLSQCASTHLHKYYFQGSIDVQGLANLWLIFQGLHS